MGKAARSGGVVRAARRLPRSAAPAMGGEGGRAARRPPWASCLLSPLPLPHRKPWCGDGLDTAAPLPLHPCCLLACHPDPPLGPAPAPAVPCAGRPSPSVPCAGRPTLPGRAPWPPREGAVPVLPTAPRPCSPPTPARRSSSLPAAAVPSSPGAALSTARGAIGGCPASPRRPGLATSALPCSPRPPPRARARRGRAASPHPKPPGAAARGRGHRGGALADAAEIRALAPWDRRAEVQGAAASSLGGQSPSPAPSRGLWADRSTMAAGGGRPAPPPCPGGGREEGERERGCGGERAGREGGGKKRKKNYDTWAPRSGSWYRE